MNPFGPRKFELLDRAAQDDLLQIRNDLMTVYREFGPDDSRLFPLRYARATPRPRHRIEGAVPVMVLPDGPDNASVVPYDSLRRALASEGVDVIMMEHRGVGLSRLDSHGADLPASAMRVGNVVADAVAVLDHAHVDKAALYGTGYGAYIALAVALEHPQRVSALVLDSPLTSRDDGKVAQEAFRAAYWHGDDPLAKRVRHLVERGVLDPLRAGPVLLAVHEHGGPNAVRDLVDLLAAGRGATTFNAVRQALTQNWLQSSAFLAEPDLVAQIAHGDLGIGSHADGAPLDPLSLSAARARSVPVNPEEPWNFQQLAAEITVPALVLAGGRDLVTPPQIAHQLAQRMPHAQIIEVPSAGHAILETHTPITRIACRWAAVGALLELPERASELVRIPAGTTTHAVRIALGVALAAERHSPWRARLRANPPFGAARSDSPFTARRADKPFTQWRSDTPR